MREIWALTRKDLDADEETILAEMKQKTRYNIRLAGRRDVRVRQGTTADFNLIDYDDLRLQPPEMVYDLPAGGKRLIQKAQGYRMTIKNGEVTFENGEATGAMPGRLLRGATSAR